MVGVGLRCRTACLPSFGILGKIESEEQGSEDPPDLAMAKLSSTAQSSRHPSQCSAGYIPVSANFSQNRLSSANPKKVLEIWKPAAFAGLVSSTNQHSGGNVSPLSRVLCERFVCAVTYYPSDTMVSRFPQSRSAFSDLQ